MPGISAFPPPGSIKSIQVGTIVITSGNTTNTGTVTSVNTANSILYWLGTRCDTVNAGIELMATMALTNATTITATRGNNGTGATTATTTSYELVEYN